MTTRVSNSEPASAVAQAQPAPQVQLSVSARAADGLGHWRPLVAGARHGRDAAFSLPALCAVALWAGSLHDIHLRDMNDLGLVSVMPASMLLGYLVLTGGFCMALRRQRASRLLFAFHLVVLIVMLYGTTTLVEEVPRFGITWRLAGVTEYIMRTGQVRGDLDAFFNWPLFFSLTALVVRLAGEQSALDFAGWAPVFFNLIDLAALAVLLRASRADERMTWLALWFFCLANWVGQDYLAPQALNYFIYLVVLGILLRYFRAGTPFNWCQPRWPWSLLSPALGKVISWLGPPTVALPTIRRGQRRGFVLIVVLLLAASVGSHQLTPFALLIAMTTLVMFGRISARGLPLALAVMIVFWLSFPARPFLSGHVADVVGGAGRITDLFAANVTARVQGSVEHILVVGMRFAFTGALWLLALLGSFRRYRAGYRDGSIALLALAPFALLLLQAYGGEMILRVYLFSLPPTVFFIAGLFSPGRGHVMSARRSMAMGLVSVALLGGFFVTRFGNERMDYFTRDEVAALQYLYRTAEHGSLLLGAGLPTSTDLPWMFQDYEMYDYAALDLESLRDRNLGAIRERMTGGGNRQAYLIITRSQKAATDLLSPLPSGSTALLEQALLQAPEQFQVVFRNEDAVIWTAVPLSGTTAVAPDDGHVASPVVEPLAESSTPVQSRTVAAERSFATSVLPIAMDEHFPAAPSGWRDDPRSTAWMEKDGYHLFAREPGRHVTIRAPLAGPVGNAVVTAVFRKVGGPPGGGYGLVVRDQGDSRGDGVDQHGRYFVLEVGDRGELGVWRREDDRWVDILPWTPSSSVHRGGERNELEVTSDGTQLRFAVNNSRVVTVEDTVLGGGAVGVFLGGDLNAAVLERFTVREATPPHSERTDTGSRVGP